MKTKIYCPDIECDSCTKVLDRRLGGVQGVEDISYGKDHILIDYDQSLVKEENMVNVIQKAGFRASKRPFERKTLKERMRHMKENKDKYFYEIKSFRYALWIFIILTGIEAIAYYGIFKEIPGFLGSYGIWLFYMNISIASIAGAMLHFYSYKTNVTCMLGMMIGMSFGMQTGMLIGAILGATNGFFVGALAGMLISVGLGIVTGQCCGIMGVLEGMMAGVMGGTMGPMVTVMMFSDNLHVFMPFYIVINLIIMWGLVYMMYEEGIEGKAGVRTKNIDFFTFGSFVIIVATLIIVTMIYGPKSPLVSFGL